MQIQTSSAANLTSPTLLAPAQALPSSETPARVDQGPANIGQKHSLDQRLDAYMAILADNKKVSELTDHEISELDKHDAQVGNNKASRLHMTAREAIRLKNSDGSGELSKMLSQRPDLRSEDLYEEDAMGHRSLRPSLADPNRLAALAARPDLRPMELDNVRDPKVLIALSKRPDLRPQELDQMKEGFHSRLKAYFPPDVACALAHQCSDESMELMAVRGPDTRPDNLMRFYDTIHGAMGPMGGQQTPFLFLKGVSLLKERPDLNPDGLTALTATIGEVGYGAHPGAIGNAIDRSFTALRNPNIELGQVIGAAEGVRALPEPGTRMEALSRIALELQPEKRADGGADQAPKAVAKKGEVPGTQRAA